MRLTSTFSLVLAALVAGLLTPTAAGAQPKAAAPPSGAPAKGAPPKASKEAAVPAGVPVDVAALTKKVRSGDASAMQEAFDELRIAGPAGAQAAPPVAEALKRGLTLPLTQSAIETLGDLEAEVGAAAVAPYATHRDAKVRRAAVKTLARTRSKDATPVLRRALSDSDATVRGTAASGLGALKAKDAVPELFIALDHRVNEAAAAIGQLCSADQCETLATKVGKLPFDIATSGLEPVLFRSAAEVPDDAKVRIIGGVRDLKTAEAHKFLRDVQARWPKAGSARVKQSIDQAVSDTTNASGSSGGGK